MCQYVYISTAAVVFWNETLIVPSTRCLGTESPAPRGARDPETHQTASHSERPPSSLNQTLLSLLSAAPHAPSPPSTPKGRKDEELKEKGRAKTSVTCQTMKIENCSGQLKFISVWCTCSLSHWRKQSLLSSCYVLFCLDFADENSGGIMI